MYCQNIHCCGFFHKFHDRNHHMWKNMITYYCRDGQQTCVRRLMFMDGDFAISDTFLPVGVHASSSLLSLT
jgi:hypothetical protein